MNKRKLLTGLLIFCLFFQMTCTTAAAAESGAAYTYTVTFYAGNQGAFTGTEGIYVYTDRFAVADGITKSMRDDGSAITVKGLKAGYRISFNDIPVNLAEDSRYYVRGLRQSGRDNATVAAPSFEVQQDADYVVVYGIRGNTVSYEVRYEDADGNTIAPSREYIGNVGDRPVVAFLYIEGYEPQAYNLVKALTENAAENVFTFVYSRIETGENQPPAPAPDGTPEPEDGNQPPAPVPGDETPADAEVPVPGDGTPGDAGAPVPEGGAEADAGVPDDEGGTPADEGVDIPDDNIPQDDGPDQLIDLDDEDVPLADAGDGNNPLAVFDPEQQDGRTNMLRALAVGLGGAVILLVMTLILIKKKKDNKKQ